MQAAERKISSGESKPADLQTLSRRPDDLIPHAWRQAFPTDELVCETFSALISLSEGGYYAPLGFLT